MSARPHITGPYTHIINLIIIIVACYVFVCQLQFYSKLYYFPSPSPSCPVFTCPSPYKVKVLPTHDASKVRASGPGLNTTGVPASLPVEFTIDAKDAGEGLLAVQITVSALRLSTHTHTHIRGRFSSTRQVSVKHLKQKPLQEGVMVWDV